MKVVARGLELDSIIVIACFSLQLSQYLAGHPVWNENRTIFES